MPELSEIVLHAVGELEKAEEEYKEMKLKYEEVVRLCGRAMQMIHASNMEGAKELYKDIGNILGALPLSKDASSLVAMQEYAELSIMLSIVNGGRIPGYTELGITPTAYILGLADTVGELRRQMLESLRTDDYARATLMFEHMSNIYELMLPIRFSNAILPGYRRKLDTARAIVEQCRRDIVMYKISKNL